MGESKFPTDLNEQVIHPVAHPASAVGPKIRQIFTNLGRVDASHLCELFRRGFAASLRLHLQ